MFQSNRTPWLVRVTGLLLAMTAALSWSGGYEGEYNKIRSNLTNIGRFNSCSNGEEQILEDVDRIIEDLGLDGNVVGVAPVIIDAGGLGGHYGVCIYQKNPALPYDQQVANGRVLEYTNLYSGASSYYDTRHYDEWIHNWVTLLGADAGLHYTGSAVTPSNRDKKYFPEMVAPDGTVTYPGYPPADGTSIAATTCSATDPDKAEDLEEHQDAELGTHESDSYDPNEKRGVAGHGDARFVTGKAPLFYQVAFENDPVTATADAQVVAISDRVASSYLDRNSFSFGPVTVGDRLIEVPEGAHDFVTMVDLQAERGVIVRIEGHFDPVTGEIDWLFSSIDPATYDPYDQTGEVPPLAGFLPPNTDDNEPAGQGSVSYSLEIAPGTSSGTEIWSPAAGIRFDDNPVISTNEWLNTIDSQAPTSRIALAPIQTSATFWVEWAVDDVGGSGPEYTLQYVRMGSGVREPWLSPFTKDYSALFTGVPGQTYAFYSVARDAVGNLEPDKSAPDAVTTILDGDGDGHADGEDNCPATAGRAG